MERYGHLDFDPTTVDVRHAATVMLVDDRPDLHVLMLKRTAKVVFASANWVFPGGRVDPNDHAADFDRVTHGLTDAVASRMLDVPSSGLAWWLAACRETLEECGILLAADFTGELTLGPADILALRQRVQFDEGAFIDELLERNIAIDATVSKRSPGSSPRWAHLDASMHGSSSRGHQPTRRRSTTIPRSSTGSGFALAMRSIGGAPASSR